MKIFYCLRIICVLIIAFFYSLVSIGQTSWTGITSTNWSTATNWTNGVPAATTDVIIGDANFTGSFQPTLSTTSYFNNLTIGGTVAATLTVPKTLTGAAAITINPNGTVNHTATTTITVKTGWTNLGTYTGISTAIVKFSGTGSINGNLTAFQKLSINSSCVVTLNTNISVATLFTVSGTFIPAENAIPLVVSGTGALTISSSGTLKVNASTYDGNYTLSGTTTLTSASTIEYSATSINQTVKETFTYSTLRISGSGTVKTLGGNLPALNSVTSRGYIYVTSGTLDLSTYTANRGTTAVGGAFTVSNGATLKIGGTNGFPANYSSVTLGATSTVEYNGTNQAIISKTYGNLILSSSSGAAVKTMAAATTFSIAGNFTMTTSLGTSVDFTASAIILFKGAVNIGASTTFNAGAFAHSITGNTVNNGTLNGGTSTISLIGTGTNLSGSGAYSFYNLTITGAGNTVAASTNIFIGGNLATSGSGTFIPAPGETITMSGTTKTISGTGYILSNLIVSGTVTTSSSLTINGNLSVSGSFSGTGTITLSGSSNTISGTGTITFAGLSVTGAITTGSNFSISTSLNISGNFTSTAGTATFTGTSTLNGTANLYNVTLNGTSLQLATNAVLGIANTYTVTAGILNVTSTIPNTVNYNGSVAQTIKNTTYNNLILSNGNTKTAAGAIIVNGDITIASSTTFDASTYTHTVNGNWVNNGNFTQGSSTISLNGSLSTTISGSNTFNILAINKSSSTVSVTLLNDVSVPTLNMTAGSINTGANTITITSTRNGSGIILGNIQRTHAFTTGVAYAFEGSNNTITFTSVSGVTSVKVSVTVGSIADFPFGGSINRLYNITIPSGTYTATLRLHYEDAELNGNVESSMQTWNYSGSAWIAGGKSTNNTTLNYVEQTGLTNIARRWTLSDDQNVAQWNGSVSNDWSTAANWTSLQGTPALPPSASDIAQIGTAVFTNQPTISTSATVKSISFGSAKAATLTLTTGGSLTVQGNISGTWSSNTTHNININGQTMTVNGDIVMSDGTVNHAINLNIGTGTLNVTGSVNQSGDANLIFTNNGVLNIGQDYVYTSGTFTPATGSVRYNGAGSQSVAGLTYNNLTIIKSAGVASINSVATVSGNLAVTTGQLSLNANLTVAGDATISSGAISNNNSVTISVAGNWNNSGTYNSSGGTNIFNGTSAQTISATTFNNVTISKASGTATLGGNIVLNGNLAITSGTLDMSTYTGNRSSAGGSFTMAAGTSLLVGGANNFPSNFGLYSLDNASTVTYNGTIAQSVAGITYGNLTFANGSSNQKTLTGSAIVNGNISINGGATFNASTYTTTLFGNWINSGTFTAATSTVLLNGNTKTIAGNTSFYKATISGNYTALNDVTVTNTFTISTGGSFDGGATVTTISGDLINSGTLTSTGTVTFTGTIAQNLQLSNTQPSSLNIVNFNGSVAPVFTSISPITFSTVNINNTAGVTPDLGWTVSTAFNVSSGAIFTGGNVTHNINGSFTNNGTVSSSGTLNFAPVTSQTIQLKGTSFSSTGTVVFGGTGLISVTGTPNTLTNITIANTTGVSPASNWTIAGVLTINSNSIFHAGTYTYTAAGDIISNGTLNGGTSAFIMSSPTGQLSGNNTTTFYDLGVTAAGVVTANSDFNIAHNFTDNGSFDATTGTPIFTGGASCIISGAATHTLAQFTISKTTGTIVTLSANIAGVTDLQITSGILDAVTYTITKNATGGSLSISDNATLKIGGTNSLPLFTTYELDTLSNVEYNGTTQAISTVTPYGNLIISSAGTKSVSAALNVINNFTLKNATFIPGNFVDTIGGNWNMASGVFTNTGNTVYLNSKGNQTISSSGSFNNIKINKSAGSASLLTDVTVAGTLTFVSGNITTGSYKLIIPSGGTITGAGASTGWVTGNLQKYYNTSSANFEVGGASAYTPVSFTFTGLTAGSLIVSTTLSAHPNIGTSAIQPNKYINRYWTLSLPSSNSIAFTGSTTIFNWNIADNYSPITPSSESLARYSGGAWTYPAVSGTSTTTSIQTNAITSSTLGDFTVGQTCDASSRFTYTGTPYCSSGGTAIITLTNGGTAGTFTALPSGLSINSSTGAVTLSTSTPGTYTVTNTVTGAGGCSSTSTASIIITAAPSATISYAGTPYCSSAGTAAVTSSGTVGGVYSSTTGLSINSSTGAVTLGTSTAGTYAVTYTIAASGGCAVYTTTTNITITTQPSATGVYPSSPYCSNAGTASLTGGSTGAPGTFSSTPGLSINSSTGAVNLGASTPSTYTVTYTVPASGGCALYTKNTDIVITTAPSATISYTGSPYCTSAGTAAVTFSGTSGGIYTSTTGLVIDSTTGEVNLYASIPGTYTVTYAIAASWGCSMFSTTSNITVSASPAISQLLATNLIAYYKFEGNANDATGNNNGTLQNNPTSTTDRFAISNKAYLFNGASQYVSTANSYANPTDFTISIWFKTSTTTGGRLIGFGTSQTGSSSQSDRHIYMNNAGQLFFGVYSGSVNTVSTSSSYNDGNWHLATATLSSTAGMVLYVDGTAAGTSAVTTADNYTGYWRIGYDNLNGWTSQPSSYYFNGALDDAVIYSRALSAAEAATVYTSPDGAGNNGPVCSGTTLTLTSTTVAGATYAWTGPNSFTSAAQNPTLTYAIANAGIYTLQVTAGGCTSTAYTNVISSTSAGQWTGNVSTDWANAGNWCNGVIPTSSTNVVITSGATRMPVIVSSVSSNNLTINSGASVTISGTGNLNIAGNLINSGTYTDNGTTTFNGPPGPQAFSGVTVFNNLTINNIDGIILPASITVKNNLTIITGSLNVNNFNISVGGNWVNNASVTTLTAGTGTVTFNGTGAQSIGGSFATTFNNLTVSNTGSGVSLNANINIAGDLFVSVGTLDLAGFTANRTTAGGTLTVYNSTTLKIGGTNTFPVNYSIVNLVVASTVEYSGTNQTVSNQVYGNLKLSSSGGDAVKVFPATPLTILGNLSSVVGSGTSVTFTAAAPVTISGNVTIGASTTFNGGSYNHSIAGNFTNNGTFNGNTGTITLTGISTAVNGTGTQNFNNLTVAAAGVTFSSGTIQLTGNLATTGSGSFNQSSSSTLIMTGAGSTISGSGISLSNLNITGSVSTSETFTIKGNLTVNGSFTGSGGTITMSGTAKTISGTGSISFYILLVTGSSSTASDFTISSGLVITGSFSASAGTVTFTGTSTLSGTANLYNITINGTSLQLSANSVLGVAGILSLTAGILDVTSSIPNTVNFNSSGAQNINNITYNNLSLSNGNIKTASAALTVNKNLIINTGTTFIPGSYTHSIYGDWVNSGTFSAGASTVQFLGTATSNIIGATTFNVLTVNNTTSATAVTLQSNASAAIVNMITGTIFTGSNTITITNTRTGNGIILGNIQRTHAFTTGVSYAFESPENTITFSSVSSVTSITVYVSKGAIGDFPFGGSISRQYEISIPAGTYNATLRLHYEDDELNGNNESSMTLWHYNGSSWGSIGKTANNTTSNYVEHNGLTDLTNRWTLSDNANLVRWNGSVSSDWSTAANWTVLQGSASRPPSALDIVDIGSVTFTNQPTISNAVSVKNITLGSAKAVVLTMAAGGSLTTGNISGVWNTNATHTINANDQSITINGDFNLSDGTNGHSINLGIGTGSVIVAGSLVQSGDASITVSGAGNLNISRDYNYSSGTFSGGDGTVTFNGTENQVVGNVTYNNLIINKAGGVASINNTLTIAGNLSVSAGELDNLTTSTILGNVNIAAGGTLFNASILHVGGNWLNNGTYTGSGSSIFFDGSGTQTISASTFNNLNINKPSGTAGLNGEVMITGNLNITSGTFDFKTYSVTRDVIGGTVTISNGAIALIGGNNGPVNFGTQTLGLSSTVIYNGTTTQNISTAGINFGNVIFRNGGTNSKILVSPLSIKGNMTIESGATLDGSSYTLTLAGNWLNNGTFIPSTSEVVLAGTSKTVTGYTTFYKLSVIGSHSVFSDFVVNNLFSIAVSGAITSNAGIDVIVNGDLLNKGTLITNGSGTFTGNIVQTLSLINATTFVQTVNFNGSVSPILNSTSVPPEFGFLNINNTGGVNPSVSWKVDYAMTVSPGCAFNGGPSTHYLYGNLTNNGTITSTGTLDFLPATAANINMGNSFASTGTVIFGGTGAITLAGTPSSFHNIIISNTNATGITPSSNWNITNNFLTDPLTVFKAAGYSYVVGGDIDINGTLNKGTSLFTLNGSVAQDIYSGSAFNNLTINKPSTITTLSNNLTVDGTLNFTSGNIQTGSNIVILSAGAGLTGAAQNTGWISGNLQKNIETGPTVKTFEVGDDANYTPATITFGNVSSAGDLLVNTTSTEHPNISSSPINSSRSVNRYWSFTNSGVVFDNYTGTYNFVNSDVDAAAATSAFKVGLYNGSSWSLPAVASPNSNSIQATGVTSFGDIAIGEICNAGTSISYAATPYCNNAGAVNVTLTGSGGGTFTSSEGLSINLGTGSVDLSTSTPGTYNVIYTVGASSECPIYITSANITITAAPVATISYAGSPYCSDAGTASVTFSGTPGGTYSSTTGLSINSSTGEVNLSTSSAGTYTVAYSFATAGGCSAYSTTTSITIAAAPASTLSYGGSPYCSDEGTASVTFSGTPGGTYSSTTGLVINASTGTVNLVASTPGSYTVTYTIAAAVCAQYQTTATITIQTGGIWTGAINADWNNAGNWLCAGVPSSSADIVIKTGLPNYPLITTGTIAGHDLTIESGAYLTITNNGKVQIGGSINNLGVFDVTDGTVELNGTSPQTIPADVFAGNKIKNLVISNDVTLGGEDSVTGVLSFGNVSGKTLSTAGFLTLKSTALGTARVADITNAGTNPGNSITGNVEVEHYISAHRAWRLLTVPLNISGAQTIHDAWQEGVNNTTFDYVQNQDPVPGYGTHITWGSNSALGFDVGKNNSSSLKSYNNAMGAWDDVPTTNAPITDYDGYMLFVRGDRSINLSQGTSAPPTSTVLRSAGELKTGDQSFGVPATGFALVGNPYASAIDLNNIAKGNSTNIQDNFYLWDPKITGSSGVGGFVNLSWNGEFYDITPFTGDDISQYIQSGSAFFARSADGATSGTLVVKEADKTAAGEDINRPQNLAGTEKIIANLYSVNPDGTTSLVDGSMNSFAGGYSNAIDRMDALKLGNFAENLSTMREGQKLTVERRRLVGTKDTIFYRISQMKQKEYNIELTAGGFEDGVTSAWFEDSYLHSSRFINLEGTTIIRFTVTGEAGSYATDRFRLVFRKENVLPVTINSIKAWQQTGGVEVEWKTGNEINTKEYEVEKSTDALSFTRSATVKVTGHINETYNWLDEQAKAGSNYYRIKSIEADGSIKYSTIAKVHIRKEYWQVVLNANIIREGVIGFGLTNMPQGRYGVRLLNSLGQVIYTRQQSHAGGNGSGSLIINTHLAKGMYMLEFTRPDKKITKKVFVE